MKASDFAISVCCALVGAATVQARDGPVVRVLKLSDGRAFHMGNVRSVRIVSPETGAKNLTLNYSVSEPGYEFPEHVHDYSDDTFLVLQGQVDVRQGDSKRPLRTGQAAFVPAGQVHGTVTTGTGTAILISFQCPPDAALYTGARDSSRRGAPKPQGIITPGAVKLLDFAGRTGPFVHPGMGSKRVAAAQRTLRQGERFTAKAAAGTEGLLFVWKGALSIASGSASYNAGERDTVFVSGPVLFTVQNTGAAEAEFIQVEAPPGGDR